jgi:hypothetical protein
MEKSDAHYHQGIPQEAMLSIPFFHREHHPDSTLPALRQGEVTSKMAGINIDPLDYPGKPN